MKRECQIKVGLFILRRCTEPAQFVCKLCKRPFCKQHSLSNFKNTCTECFDDALAYSSDPFPPAPTRTRSSSRLRRRQYFYPFRRSFFRKYRTLDRDPYSSNVSTFAAADADAFDHPVNLAENQDDFEFEDDQDLYDS